jgi:small subunit ribosomal protein S2
MIKISLTLKQLLKTGIHLGHQKNRWNPKMSMYLIGIIKDIHIINIEYTIVMLRMVINMIKDLVINKGKLIVFINNINNVNHIISTISNKYIKYQQNKENNGIFTNKKFVKQKEFNFIPDVLFIFNTNSFIYTIREANKLKIPIIALVDSNCNPIDITYPIPGSNDSLQSIQLFSNLINKTVLDALIQENIAFKYKYNEYKII